MTNIVFAILAVILSQIVVGQGKDGLPYFTKNTLDPVWNRSAEGTELMKVEKFSFIDQSKTKFSEANIQNRVTVINFFYSQCGGICPIIMNNMKKIQDTFLTNAKVIMVSFSVTPELDTSEKLLNFGQSRQIDSQKWHLLTGDKSKIYQLAKDQFFADTKTLAQKTEDDFIHSENIFLMDSESFVRGIYNGNQKQSVLQLIEDMELLLQNEKGKKS